MKTPYLLLAEDDPEDAELILMALDKKGLRDHARAASEGQEAIDLLLGPAPLDPKPSVLLLDLMMPRLTGFDVMTRLRADARTKGLPIVVFSGSQEPVDVGRAYACGANGYMVKPIDPAEFLAAVGDAATFWLKRNIPPVS